jgi:hypothetical protein
MMLAYLEHADAYYVKNGRPTKEPEDIRYAMRPARKLYGYTLARSFGPLALKTVRRALIDSSVCLNEVNKRVGKIKRAFNWAVSEEPVPPRSIMASGPSPASAGAPPTSVSPSRSSRCRRRLSTRSDLMSLGKYGR